MKKKDWQIEIGDDAQLIRVETYNGTYAGATRRTYRLSRENPTLAAELFDGSGEKRAAFSTLRLRTTASGSVEKLRTKR